MSRFTRLTISFATLAAVAACASARGSTSASANLSGPRGEGNNGDVPTRAESPSTSSDAIPIPTEITRAVETRISDLKNRGGDCQRLGTVLESSYRSGQITLRPYMWRVGTHLASGEGKPNGDMVLAREIDSLNVGVRTVNDVLWTMEHEAAHIAFELASGNEASEEKVNQTVRACAA
jgi:hypothetical protein